MYIYIYVYIYVYIFIYIYMYIYILKFTIFLFDLLGLLAILFKGHSKSEAWEAAGLGIM